MILLLAGTAEARSLAERLAGAGVPALASLAGATREPAPLALPTRVGGFGGAERFAAFLDEAGVIGVVDATHPFATAMTARSFAVCIARGVPLLRLERPGWSPGPGDDWTMVADEREAMGRIPEGAVAFLATGRQSLPRWAGLKAARAYLRVIDPPPGPFPLPGGFVVGRPPFDVGDEAALFRRLGVTHLVAKDAGGEGARAKLDAARDLGVAVLLIRRPAPPPGLAVVATVEEAFDWALAAGSGHGRP